MGRTTIVFILSAVFTLGVLSCNQPKHDGKTAGMWASSLTDENDYKRRLACQSLGKMGPLAAEVAPSVVVLLDDVNPGVQAFCAEALGKMGPGVVPVIEPHLDSPQPTVRLHAAEALLRIEPTHQGAQQALINGFTGLGNADLSKMAREMIIRAEGVMVPQLAKLLESPFKDVRLAALSTLGFLEEFARPALPALIKSVTSDPVWQVRKAAMKALAVVGTVEETQPIFEAALDEES